jgi:thiol-disulfide isomerase/thioredoxin
MTQFSFVLVVLLSGLLLMIRPDISFAQKNSIIEVETVNVNQMAEIISAGSGRPMLINVWATWCVPCREEFPDLVSFSAKYKNKISVIGISVDLAEEKESKVIPFLQQYDAGFRNVIVDVKDPEDFINSLNKNWNGGIPATFVYDTRGNQVNFHIGKTDLEGFEEMISSVID